MPPLSPPPVPLIPAPEGFTTVATTDQLRAAINATVWLGTLALYLSPGSVLLLGGSPILVDGINLQLSSDGEGALLNAEHRSRLFEVQRGGQLTLNFLTLANGKTETNYMRGGALNIGFGSSVVVTDSLIIHSISLTMGGAAAVSGGSLLLSNSSLVHSSCDSDGGALYCGVGGSVILTNASSIHDSVAHNGGGAAYITFGSMLLDAGSMINMSRAMHSFQFAYLGGHIRGGGAILADNALVTLLGASSIINSSANTLDGGAIVVTSVQLGSTLDSTL
eukprot:1113296-Prymnesium_polylepis.1